MLEASNEVGFRPLATFAIVGSALPVVVVRLLVGVLSVRAKNARAKASEFRLS